MKTRLPTSKEIAELVGFLPRLYAEGFVPIERWYGGEKDENGVFTLPWPEYSKVVADFFQVASRKCWCDYGYVPEEAGQMLEDGWVVRNASLAQVKTMLTYCVRGERFATGHWAWAIEQGHICRLLERLAELNVEKQGPQSERLLFE